MLVNPPQLALQGYLFASYYFIWAAVLNLMSVMNRFMGSFYNNEDLLSEIDTPGRFDEMNTADLHLQSKVPRHPARQFGF